MATVDLSQQQRVQLLVTAEVARIRADRAKHRAAVLERRVRPLVDAVDRFAQLRRRRPDLTAPADAGQVLAWAGAAAELSWELIEEARRALVDASGATSTAVRAMQAVSDARQGDEAETPLAWAGVDREVVERLVEEELARDSA
jgi:hypothetical protein